MPFRYTIASMDGRRIGELARSQSAKDRTMARGVSRNMTASVTVPVENPLTDQMLDGPHLLLVHETGLPAGQALRFAGEVANGQENGAGIRFNYAGPAPVLFGRALGRSATGAGPGYTAASPTAPRDKSLLVADIVNTANALGHTGVVLGDILLAGGKSYLDLAPYKTAGEALQELFVSLDGPEYRLDPVEPSLTDEGIVTLAAMTVGPGLGQLRASTAFQYGTAGRNVVDYDRSFDYAGTVDDVFGVGGEATDPVVKASASTLSPARSRRDTVVSLDVPALELRQAIVDEHLRIRHNARQLVSLQPSPYDPERPTRTPRYGVDFIEGDVVRVIIVKRGTVRVNAYLRVYGVTWATDAAGTTVLTLTFTPT